MTLFLNTTMEHILTWKAKSCIYVDSSFVCVCSDLQSPNKPTVPQEKIRPLTSLDHPQSPFYDPEGGAITPVARVVVERIARKVCSSNHLSPFLPFFWLLHLSNLLPRSSFFAHFTSYFHPLSVSHSTHSSCSFPPAVTNTTWFHARQGMFEVGSKISKRLQTFDYVAVFITLFRYTIWNEKVNSTMEHIGVLN